MKTKYKIIVLVLALFQYSTNISQAAPITVKCISGQTVVRATLDDGPWVSARAERFENDSDSLTCQSTTAPVFINGKTRLKIVLNSVCEIKLPPLWWIHTKLDFAQNTVVRGKLSVFGLDHDARCKLSEWYEQEGGVSGGNKKNSY